MLSGHHRTAGFTLIEVMVAMLILSIGLLGMAGLQAVSLKMNQSAQHSSQATFLAYDIIDRMRANRQAALDGDYDMALGCDGPGGASVAANDVANWLLTVCGIDGESSAPGALPQKSGATGAAIEVDADRIVTVTLTWFDARWQNNDDGTDADAEAIRSEVIKAEL